ncbi:unnamed protein product, partial [Adineta steineri]
TGVRIFSSTPLSVPVEVLRNIRDCRRLDGEVSLSEPNFVKAGSVIDTSAKIYGYRVDALHAETQKLNGAFQDKDGDEEELNRTSLDPIETPKQITSRNKIKKSSYLATDLSTISLSYEFEFHPFQPSNLC